MDITKKCVSLFVTLLSFYFGHAQNFIPGEVYFDSTGFVEYRVGNLPLILSAPHGGLLDPDSIPDRMCDGCVLVNDAWTKPITEGVYDRIVELTGCYPHVVINLLRRSKFDANRDIDDAAAGNLTVEQSWRGYHAFIDAAKTKVVEDFSRGLFLDMHGHGHTIQRIELGYLLSRSELQLTDSDLNTDTLIEESSIRTLTSDNIQGHTHSELLRGETSLGTLLMDSGFPTVPSSLDPFPQGIEPYFSGGFNTVRHGSRDNGGDIDAIQVEMNQDIRFDDSTRLVLIDSLATVALEYYELQYDSEFQERFCNLVSTTSDRAKENSLVRVYPNPADTYFVIDSELDIHEVGIFNALGQELVRQELSLENRVKIVGLSAGLYFVQFFGRNGLVGVEVLVVE